MRNKQKGARTPGAPDRGLERLERPATLAAQVEQLLRRAIAEGRFAGGRLPPETDLAEQLGVSRETVRLAADSLQREGLLVKYRRRGTFISPPTLTLAEGAGPPAMLAWLQADYGSGAGGEDLVTRGTAGSLLHGAIAEAASEGLELVVRQAHYLRMGEAFDEMHRRVKLSGVMFASFGEEKLLRRVAGLGLPMVLVDHDLHLPQLNSVREDSFEAGRLAVAHLAGSGHRQIAFVGWQQTDLNPWRLRGYRQGLRDAGLTPRRRWEFAVELNAAGARSALHDWLALSPRPTALYCFNNAMARLVLDELRTRGLRVPTDVSVLGGGGEEVNGLTCHQADWFGIGRAAVQILRRNLAGPDSHRPEHVLIRHTIRAGETTARLAPAAGAGSSARRTGDVRARRKPEALPGLGN